MKSIALISILLFFVSLTNAQSHVVFQEKDQLILNKIYAKLDNNKKKPTAELVALVGKTFLGTPYVAHTLEGEKEQLIVNLGELDCTTYAENCLAIARSIKNGRNNFEGFTEELEKIRYRNGRIDQYPSRLHYFSDWIYENNRAGYVQDVSEQISHTPYPLEVDFMSTHPNSYQQLKKHPEFVQALSEKEKTISKRQMYYLPKQNLPEYENELREGDIVGITTSIAGLDITHVGILIRQDGRIHLMHASSVAEKVVISEEPLEDYLNSGSKVTGIMVARPR